MGDPVILKNTLKYFFAALFLVGVIVSAAVYYKNTGTTESATAIKQYPGPQQEIRGLKFESYSINGTHFILKAKRLAVQKKKVGFFRFGLMNELRIEDAVLTIDSGRTGGFKGDKDKEDSSFIQSLTSNFLPKSKSIKALVIEPIIIEISDREQVISKISAKKASVKQQNRSLYLENKVRIETKSRLLETDTLYLEPESGEIKSNGHYTFKTPSDSCSGTNISSDIFLNHICKKQ